MATILSPEDLIVGRAYVFTLEGGSEREKINAAFDSIDRKFNINRFDLIINISYKIKLAPGMKKELVSDFIFWKRIIKIQEI